MTRDVHNVTPHIALQYQCVGRVSSSLLGDDTRVLRPPPNVLPPPPFKHGPAAARRNHRRHDPARLEHVPRLFHLPLRGSVGDSTVLWSTTELPNSSSRIHGCGGW